MSSPIQIIVQFLNVLNAFLLKHLFVCVVILSMSQCFIWTLSVWVLYNHQPPFLTHECIVFTLDGSSLGAITFRVCERSFWSLLPHTGLLVSVWMVLLVVHSTIRLILVLCLGRLFMNISCAPRILVHWSGNSLYSFVIIVLLVCLPSFPTKNMQMHINFIYL